MSATVANLSLSDHLSEAGLSKWFEQLNATDAPIPRRNLQTALRFFQQQMPVLSPAMALNFLLAMDLSKMVREVHLNPNEEILAFRSTSEPEFKLFYTRPGASRHNSGINPAGRVPVRYKVHQGCAALESYTTGAIDVWSLRETGQPTTVAPRGNSTGVMAIGGGVQLIIPGASRYLTVLRVGNT